ncbi:GGDEF domain-containing protein [Clostridioides sp. GD02368]|uniref:GGDEF domain-containing protein n=1 Tax=unclassified Clostridioides TaxID=2635829 RepID=UPI0007BBD7CF|nr:GGDEF domain-containing protein [Clostridioides sp. ZZV14-6387]MDI0265183.1 GGDEF domain-containing protein [Clostridioides difficile]MDI7818192.1 GGDEF domain-containing protein [Clostridioides difficile]NJJ36347.1 GGDEF domain-containing protein [Clostridioides difficile]NJK13413.1 GGDEF domain-containing protein [Clostridioides difficile]
MEEIDDTILDLMFRLTLNERLLNNNDFIENNIDVVKNSIDCYKTEQNSLMLLKSNFLLALLYGVQGISEKMKEYILISYKYIDKYLPKDYKFLARFYSQIAILSLKNENINKANLHIDKFNVICNDNNCSVEEIIFKSQLIYIKASKCIESSIIIKEIEDLYIKVKEINDFNCKKIYFFIVGKIYFLFLDDAIVAKVNFLQARKYADLLKDMDVSSLCNIKIGECECSFENYEGSIDCFNEVISNKKYINVDTIQKYRASNNITKILIKTKNYPEAINNLAKSEVYLEKIKNNNLKETEKFGLFINLAMYYAKSNENSFEQSICYLDRAKDILSIIKSEEEYILYDLEVVYNQVKIYYCFGDYNSALDTSKKLFEKSKNAKNYNYVRLAYKNIYMCFEMIQDYEMSMKYFKMYYELKMMYVKARNRNYIDSLNYRYEYVEKEINNMRKIKTDLDKKKYIDHLTSAYNRVFLNNFLEGQEVSEYSTAFMIDVDYFKNYNDTYGHYNGDIALKNITTIIKKYLKKDMLIIRYGGEEFLILSICKDYKKSKIFGRKLCRSVKKFLNNNLTISIGIDTCKNSSIDISEIIGNADKALYKAKQSGRNRCLHYHDFKNF